MNKNGQALLLILGGGSSQLNAIRRARDYGFAVAVADLNPAAPGCALADHVVPVSTLDTEGLCQAARALGVAAVVAIGTDQPVYSAAAVASSLGLAHPLSPEQALLVTNKAVMKPLLADLGIPTLPFRIVREAALAADIGALATLPAPWVVKPADSQGQRGIKIVGSVAELKLQLPTTFGFSRTKTAIVETYYHSREVTLSGWADDGGGVSVWSVSDRITFDPASVPGLGVCLGHRYPAVFGRDWLDDICGLTVRIARGFGLRGVPLYFQFLIGADGVVVNELACRLGGAYEDHWLPLACGVDSLDWQLRSCAGLAASSGYPAAPPAGAASPISDSATWDARQTAGDFEYRIARQRQCVVVPLVFAWPGVVSRLAGVTPGGSFPELAGFSWLQREGTRIGELDNSTQRLAYAILQASEPETVNRAVRRLFAEIRAESVSAGNLARDTVSELLFPGVPT